MQVPNCYIHNKIPRLEAQYFYKFAHDTLFYIFYSSPGDEVQLFAAEELCKNKWMYHRTRQVRPGQLEVLQYLRNFLCPCQYLSLGPEGAVRFITNSFWGKAKVAPGARQEEKRVEALLGLHAFYIFKAAVSFVLRGVAGVHCVEARY